MSLDIPSFLRRSDRLTDDQVARLIDPSHHIWIMPDWSKYRGAETMAKADFAVENRAAPVTVNRYRSGEEPVMFHVFPNMDEFEAWYSPSRTKCLGANSRPLFTDVLLEIPTGMPSPAPSTGSPSRSRPVKLRVGVPAHTPQEKASPGPEKVPAGNNIKKGQRYLDSRHVSLMVAAGFKDTGKWPHEFQYKKQVITFDLPPDGKRWATLWNVDGKSGRGVSTLFRTLGLKEK